MYRKRNNHLIYLHYCPTSNVSAFDLLKCDNKVDLIPFRFHLPLPTVTKKSTKKCFTDKTDRSLHFRVYFTAKQFQEQIYQTPSHKYFRRV